MNSFPENPFELMSVPAPAVGEAAVLAMLETQFGLNGALKPLVSERDQNFALQTETGERFVVKISNPGEAPAVLDFQARALAHIAAVAPDLPVPHIRPTTGGELLSRIDTGGGDSLVRVVSWLDGVPVDDVPKTRNLRTSMASTLAELGRALRGFFHPAGRHALLWDVNQARAAAGLVEHITDPRPRHAAEAVFEHHARNNLEQLTRLRAQVIHNDCNPDNALVAADDHESISGMIDFGDMVHAPLVNDLAVAAAYQVVDVEDPVSAACDLVGAYHAVYPLEADELDVLFDLIMLRLAMSISICAWRAGEHPENVDYILGNYEHNWRTLEALLSMDANKAAVAFRDVCSEHPAPFLPRAQDEANLTEKRTALLGPSLRLTYDKPLHITRGRGAWLYDADGRAFLDAYNNVACVGHSHPAVVEAIATQSARLNTNTRYLHDNIVAYAERLTGKLPGDLSVCYFVCTGTEANDLAWQIACSVSGGDGAIVTDFAYHGNSTAVAQLSPEELASDRQEDWVATVAPPDTYRDPRSGADYASALDGAIETLESRGRRPAAFFADTIYTSDGIFIAPRGYLDAAWQRVRNAGGLCVADEVQAGFGRTGEHFWGFEQQAVIPDIVTLGKPMGNGHPLAAVVTTPAIAAAFAKDRYYFNTFGGNPVSCAAGLAVLDVLEREQLQANAREAGARLRAHLDALAERYELIGDVRGSGLFHGVELVRDRQTRDPAPDEALRVMNAMRNAGVLIGRTGRHGNVLKIRPPLVFSRDNADQLAATLDEVLQQRA